MGRNFFRQRSRTLNGRQSRVGPSRAYRVLAGYLVFVFLLGSGSRGDLASLIVLRPVAVLVSAWALLQLDRASLVRWRGLLILAGALFLLPILHLIPLPAPLWHALPGRELIVAISRATGSLNSARPLSMSPADTINALCSLFVPLAALLLAIRLKDREQRLLLPLTLALGALTVGVGSLQALNPGSEALHFYRTDTMKAASGLFANRNHQALFLACLLPMLAAFAISELRSAIQQKVLMAMGIAVLLPLLLITGSRAGLILGVVAIFSILTLMPSMPVSRKIDGWQARLSNPRLLVGAAAVMLLGVVALSRRAEAFKRLFSTSMAEESRLQIWRPAIRAAADLMPFGSGVGSFVRTYQVYETHDLLTPTYRNHAHNEFIEIAMTGGVPAILILIAATTAWASLTWKWMRRAPCSSDVVYGRLGAILLLLFAISSTVDYPARVPSLACLMVIAAIWMKGTTRALSPRFKLDGAARNDHVSGFTPSSS